MKQEENEMYRITASVTVAFNSFDTITFHIRAANVAYATAQAIAALELLGYSVGEYALTYSPVHDLDE